MNTAHRSDVSPAERSSPPARSAQPLIGDVRGIVHFAPGSLSELRSALVDLAFQLDRLPLRLQRLEAERILAYLEHVVVESAMPVPPLNAAWREKLFQLAARHRRA
ncbi:MAG: hypothetical protein RMM58_14260 [Chloroflexota bacterium]|nr:hypothetical protein [Dehalococcoidia bacterium]MDW8255036.1 hypothetical protein [Chloroflexota bacterium]